MDSNTLFELRNKLAVLPVLEQKMKSLNSRLYQAEDDVKNLLRKYQDEALDVDQIQKDSLSNTLLKLIGKYEGKVNKETREMLTAKLEYDKAVERVKELNREKYELGSQLSALNKEKHTFEAELANREMLIKNKVSQQAYDAYMEIQNRQAALARQLVETDEALSAAGRVISASDSAIRHLESAENWATYDIWGGGGIISHMAKYDHIDDAQADLNRLSSLTRDFEKELADVNMHDVYARSGIDSTTRAIDFWFDNIFTDLRVRDKIRDDREQISRLVSQVNMAVNKLETNKSELKRKLSETENQKNNLIMNFEELQD